MDILTYSLCRKYADSVGTSSYEFQALKSLAEHSNRAIGVVDYESLVSLLNTVAPTTYDVGQSFLVQTLDVPDVWIYEVTATNVPYTYTTDEAISQALMDDGQLQIGNFVVSALETLKQDLTNYISSANMPVITQTEYDALTSKDPNTYYFITDEE